MIPEDLQKQAMTAFKAHCRLHNDVSGNPWTYKEDLQRAINAVIEVSLRYAQKGLCGGDCQCKK